MAHIERGLSSAPLAAATGTATPASSSVQQRKGAYQMLMSGVSHMIPFVVVGGLLIAVAYGIGGEPTPGGLAIPKGSFFETLAGLGGLGFTLMVPILSGYIAYAIADRPGLAPGPGSHHDHRGGQQHRHPTRQVRGHRLGRTQG
ncbi:MAG: hypothetical protein ACK5LN_02760 [Propioniciclava sp.]